MGFLSESKSRRKVKAEKRESMRLRRALLTTMYQDHALNSRDPGVAAGKIKPVIVSLTTYSKRIYDVHVVIESIFQQSLKADKVVLWLSKEDFSPEDVPEILRIQSRRGLEIEFCDKDLGPYTKYFYALQKYPDALVLTVDDDVLYPLDMIDQLYRAYCKVPSVIHCHRAHLMRLDDRGNIKPYNEWDLCTGFSGVSPLVFPTGVGGVLYYPGCFDSEILNRERFLLLAPKADDIWLKAMSLKRGVQCQIVPDSRDWEQRFLMIEGSQKHALKHENMKDGAVGNDVKMKAVFDYYDIWALLKS